MTGDRRRGGVPAGTHPRSGAAGRGGHGAPHRTRRVRWSRRCSCCPPRSCWALVSTRSVTPSSAASYDAGGSTASSAWTTTATSSPDDDAARPFKNNVIWVVVAPALRHRARPDLRGADRTGPLGHGVQADRAFMPMAISMLAAGIIFRLVYDQDPDQGVANAVVVGVHDTFARARRSTRRPARHAGRDLKAAGGRFVHHHRRPSRRAPRRLLPLVGIAPTSCPHRRRTRSRPPQPPAAGSPAPVWLRLQARRWRHAGAGRPRRARPAGNQGRGGEGRQGGRLDDAAAPTARSACPR